MTAPDSPGLLTGLNGAWRNLAGLLNNRAQLAMLELGQVRANVVKLLILGVSAVVAALFGLAYWTVLIVYVSWDALGGKILLIMAAAFTAIAVGAVFYAKSLLGPGKLSIPATLAELRRDRDALL
ncbi:MAG: phage holin family protein [Pseudomonadota bacterium]